jgi:hypothetical protein
MRVRGYARFTQATFGGQVIFKNAEIAGSFEAPGIKCNGGKGDLNFDRIRVADAAEFNNAEFSGSVSFQGANIGLFRATTISFINSSDKKGESISSNQLLLTNARFQGIQITGNNGSSPSSMNKLDLTGLVTSGEISIKNLTIGDLDAAALRVQGQLSLEGVAIKNHIDLENSSLSTIDLKNVELLSQKQNSLSLEGMRFQHMHVSGEAGDSKRLTYDNLKHLIDNSPSAYANLERLYESLGERKYQQLADEMFFKRKGLELKDEEDFLVKTLHRGWYYLAGYGRRPLFTLCWIIIFCIIGCFVFRKSEWMVKQESNRSSHQYNCIWYSFDLFLPFIDLQSASLWMPLDDRKWSKIYMRFHRILGWVLLPVFLATLTGIAK